MLQRLRGGNWGLGLGFCCCLKEVPIEGHGQERREGIFPPVSFPGSQWGIPGLPGLSRTQGPGSLRKWHRCSCPVPTPVPRRRKSHFKSPKEQRKFRERPRGFLEGICFLLQCRETGTVGRLWSWAGGILGSWDALPGAGQRGSVRAGNVGSQNSHRELIPSSSVPAAGGIRGLRAGMVEAGMNPGSHLGREGFVGILEPGRGSIPMG